jgi:hypothetical protein
VTSRVDPRLRALAEAALNHTIAQRGDLASEAMQALAVKYGGDGIVRAVLLWIDALIHHSGRDDDRGKPATLTFLNHQTGTVESSDEVPDDTAWAGRVIAARFADDPAMFQALMNSCTADTFPERVGELLGMVALAFRLALGLETAS